MATLTFVYVDSTAVLGPLSIEPEPGAYDLCLRHAERTSVPQGWQVLKLPLDGRPDAAAPPSDDLMALADAVRAIGLRYDDPQLTATAPTPPADLQERVRGGHLRLVGTDD